MPSPPSHGCVPYASMLSKPWDFSFLAMSIRCFLAASMPCPTSLLLRRRASSNSLTASQDRRKMLVTRAPISLIRSAYAPDTGVLTFWSTGRSDSIRLLRSSISSAVNTSMTCAFDMARLLSLSKIDSTKWRLFGRRQFCRTNRLSEDRIHERFCEILGNFHLQYLTPLRFRHCGKEKTRHSL